MINHIVLFKMRDFDTLHEKASVLNQFKTMLLALKDTIDELKFIEVGITHNLELNTYDVSLITHFESLAELDSYRVHPEHQKVVEFIKDIVVERAAVDYII